MEYYLRIDEKENALDSLHKATDFLQYTKIDLLYWKWFIVAIHHASYHLMLLTLQNTDQSGIWREPKKRVNRGLCDKMVDIWKWLIAMIRHNRGLSRKVVDIGNPKNMLVDFLEAFGRIQNKERMRGYCNSKPFIANNKHKEAVKTLNTILRNNFVHFSPKGWSIQIQYIIDAVLPTLEVIEFLVFDSGRLFLEEQQRNIIRLDINLMRQYLNDIKFDASMG
jgi:hypothetical protein